MNARLQASSWYGELSLRYQARGERTVSVHPRHQGPLRVQSAFYPEGGLCHSYILHPPGGVVGGDRLQLNVQVEPGAHALLTAPGANKFYRSAGGRAHFRQDFRLAEGASLESLPHEQIVFDGARAELETHVSLATGSRLFAWELNCLGRPAAAERYRSGELRMALSVDCDGEPLLRERLALTEGSALRDARWGLDGQAVLATCLVYPADAADLEVARQALGEQAAATLLEGLLVCRYLGPSAVEARACFIRLWRALRPALLGRQACPPRIWAT